MRTAFITLCFISLGVCIGCEQEEKQKTRIVMPHKGFRMMVLDNSETISQALAINSHGHVIGTREKESKIPGVFNNAYFFDDGEKAVELSMLEGFTNSEVHALSDNRLAVGYASRRMGHAEGSLAALLWDIQKNEVIRLPQIEGDLVAQATDISMDGKRIVGYSTGNDPERLRPCLWEFSDAANSWVAKALPTKELYNPYAMSSSVKISPNGKVIASCVTDTLEDKILDSSLFLWEENESMHWERRKVCDEQFYLGGVNDKGLVAGDSTTKRGKRFPCIVEPSGKFQLLSLFEGTDSGKALDVNNAGDVIGVCNDPPGPEGGPHPFIYRDGKMRRMDLPSKSTFCLVNAINESGQIAGMGDITFEDRFEENAETGEKEPLVKALAFIWEASK